VHSSRRDIHPAVTLALWYCIFPSWLCNDCGPILSPCEKSACACKVPQGLDNRRQSRPVNTGSGSGVSVMACALPQGGYVCASEDWGSIGVWISLLFVRFRSRERVQVDAATNDWRRPSSCLCGTQCVKKEAIGTSHVLLTCGTSAAEALARFASPLRGRRAILLSPMGEIDFSPWKCSCA